MHKVLPTRREALLAATLAVLAFVLVKYVTPALAESPAAHASSSAQITEEVEAVLPSVAQGQKALDKLPGFLVSGRQALPDVDATTVRVAGAKDSIRYWTALNTQSEVCLIALLPGEDQLAAMTCQSAAQLSGRALALQFSDQTRAVRVLMVPPETDRALKDFVPVGDQLLIGSSAQPLSEKTLETAFDRTAKRLSNQIEIPALDALRPGDAFQ